MNSPITNDASKKNNNRYSRLNRSINVDASNFNADLDDASPASRRNNLSKKTSNDPVK